MKFRYSRNYYPAAPMVDVTFIAAAEQERVGPLPAMVDSGADGTIVPIQYLDEIQARQRLKWSCVVNGARGDECCYIW